MKHKYSLKQIIFITNVCLLAFTIIVFAIVWKDIENKLIERQRNILAENSIYLSQISENIYNAIRESALLISNDKEITSTFGRSSISFSDMENLDQKVSSIFYSDSDIKSFACYTVVNSRMIYRKKNEIARLVKIDPDEYSDYFLVDYVIPGSSISEVYEDTDVMYAKLRTEIEGYKAQAEKNLSGEGDALVVFNPNGFDYSGYITLPNGKKAYAENVPSLGYKVIMLKDEENSISVSERRIETPFYVVEFNEKMQITRLFDKENQREVVPEGEKANVLRVFENYPYDYDNWELCNYHEQKYYDVEKVEKVETFSEGGTAGLRITWKYLDSTICQEIRFYNKNRRIDFSTKADWHEVHMYLKTLFPVTVRAEEATYEIQYGNVRRPGHRNTSWDQARFEVCAHKWMDVSEEGYGVSLLNDCKYGHSYHGNVMALSLIKTGTYPSPNNDVGEMEFTYAVLPHSGDFRKGDTVREAYVLNRPMEVVSGASDVQEFSLARCDANNIVLETAKQAENGEGTILRLYDAWNCKSNVTVKLGFEAKEIWLCDLLENPLKKIGAGSEVTLPVSGFEIQTLLLK